MILVFLVDTSGRKPNVVIDRKARADSNPNVDISLQYNSRFSRHSIGAFQIQRHTVFGF